MIDSGISRQLQFSVSDMPLLSILKSWIFRHPVSFMPNSICLSHEAIIHLLCYTFYVKKDIYKIPSFVLLVLGLTDLLRGFLHTFQVNFAAETFAKLDLRQAKSDQLFLLGAFGISNILTGFLYILISQKAKKLSPYVLLIIPVAYAVGLFGLKSSGISGTSAFYGKYFMLVYLAVSLGTFLFFLFQKSRK